MPLVFLSSVDVFFDGESKLIKHGENAYDSHRGAKLVFDIGPGYVSAMVHASMRDKTHQVLASFSDSLRIRLSLTRTTEEFNTREENESMDSKTNIIIVIQDMTKPAFGVKTQSLGPKNELYKVS